jgi:hypothetical protein
MNDSDMRNSLNRPAPIARDDDRKTLIYAVFALVLSALLIGVMFWMWAL